MKRTKRLLSTLLALCMVLAMLPATAMAAAPAPVTDRYTVLVLDHSGSMRGDPIYELRDAAWKFCQTVKEDTSGVTNHVAIVGFSTYGKVEHEFTTVMDDLRSCINSFYADGMTNMGDALAKAKALFTNVPADATKNIVLLSDGLPEIEEIDYNYTLQTTYANKGPYSMTVYPLGTYFIGSANYTHEKIKELGFIPDIDNRDFNIYTIGFFHRLSDARKALCEQVLKDIANKGFYEVASTNDLEFVLGEVVSDDILNVQDPVAPDAQTFDPNTYPQVRITIACPVDVTVTPRGVSDPVLDSNNSAKLDCGYGKMVVESAAGTKTLTLDAKYRYDIKVTAQTGAPSAFPVNVTATYHKDASSSDTLYAKPIEMKANQVMPIYVRASGTSVQPIAPYDPTTTTPGNDAEDKPSNFTFVPTVTGGTVVLSKRNAEEGDWVNIYVTPDEGYKLESLTVTDQRGWPVTVREMGENAFSFTMPNARINVNPVFVKVEEDDLFSTNVPDTIPDIPNVDGTSPNYGSMVINTAAMNYSDVNAGDWFYNNVKFCHERYLLNNTGEADGKFEPNTASTRATVWTALSRLAGRNTVTQGDNWYDRAQIWAKGKGITDGERPMDSMTREEFVTMLWRYDGNKYVQNNALGQFNDGTSVSWWATEAVKWAVATGLLNGSNGSLNPQSNVTRAEVAAVLQRYVQSVH